VNIDVKNSQKPIGVSFELAKNNKGGACIVVKNTYDDLPQEQKQSVLSKISQKLSSGKKLNGDEMKLLQKNSPDLYRKAVFIEMERRQMKKQLAACKSKKEVRDLYDRKMMQFLAEQKAIEKSSMPKEKKDEAIEFLKMRQEAFNDEFKEFKESDKYKSLPEKRKEEKDRFDSAVGSGKDDEKEICFWINEETEKSGETDDVQVYFEQEKNDTRINILA
jgi:hypothetical protein